MSTKICSGKIKEPVKRNSAAEAAEFVGAWVLVCVIIAGVQAFFKVLALPFAGLFASDRAHFQNDLKSIAKKKDNREMARCYYKIDPNNMFVQCKERFKLHPAKYKGDPDNVFYKQWLNEYNNKTLIDVDMLWAPEAISQSLYLETAENRFGLHINKELLYYVENQVKLINQKPELIPRFLKTINNQYPEFRPRMDLILEDIQMLKVDAEAKADLAKFCKSLWGYEFSDVASELAQDPESLPKKLPLINFCTKNGLSEELFKVCWDNNFDLYNCLVMAKSVDPLARYGAPEVALAVLTGDLSGEDLEALLKSTDEDPEEDSESWAREIKAEYNKLINKQLFNA